MKKVHGLEVSDEAHEKLAKLALREKRSLRGQCQVILERAVEEPKMNTVEPVNGYEGQLP